jgi:hypothetical protein
LRTRGRARRPYKIRSEETWALVREGYLNGAPARVLAERYDVTVSGVRARIHREGWTKHGRLERPAPALGRVFAEAPVAEAEPAEVAGAGPDGPADPETLAAEALARAGRAMRAGRLAEAEGLARFARALQAVRTPGPGGGGSAAMATTVGEDGRVMVLPAGFDELIRRNEAIVEDVETMLEDHAAHDPAGLAKLALAEAARAIRGGRLDEARRLTQVAEGLSRVAARQPKTALDLAFQALSEPETLGAMFRIDPDTAAEDPDIAVKRRFWGWSAEQEGRG